MKPQSAISDPWKDACPPPLPYVQVPRRTFPSGLHVLVLVRETGGKFAVLSAVDRGTAPDTLIAEGRAASAEETVARVAKICKRGDRAKAAGRLSGTVPRDTLVELTAQGTIRWDDQVWEETEGSPGRAGEPALARAGFPQGQRRQDLEFFAP